MRLLLIMRLLLFTIGLKLSRGYYNGGGYYPSAVTITGNTVNNNSVKKPDFKKSNLFQTWHQHNFQSVFSGQNLIFEKNSVIKMIYPSILIKSF